MSLAAKTWCTWREETLTDQRINGICFKDLINFFRESLGESLLSMLDLVLISENYCFNALIYIYVLLCTFVPIRTNFPL